MNKKSTIFIFLLLTNCLLAQKNIDSLAVRFSGFINRDDLEKHLKIIASDEYEGRETGKTGQKMAARYLAGEFEKTGIKPYEESYFQTFALLEKTPSGTITINGNDFGFKKDFYFFPGISDTVFTTSEIIFLGYGIDDKMYSDYTTDVKNKVILVLDGEPYDNNGKSRITTSPRSSEWTSDSRRKINIAKDKGAAALVIIKENYEKTISILAHYIESPSLELKDKPEDPSSARRRLHSFFISEKMAKTILNVKEINKLKKKINATGKTIHKTIRAEISVDISRSSEEIVSENVIAFIEGTDKKEEVLILTAHYDHLGKDSNEVYNGADDDGSGTVALLEMAQAFQEACAAGHRPRRSILIMPVSGEEKGLLGSLYYSEFPLFPIKNTIANLNIDMIGRLDEKHQGNPNYVYVIGSDRLSKDLHEINENANKTYTKLELDYTFNSPDDPNKFYYRSDHYNFARKNIPVIFYFTGVHEDYHKPTDEVHKIDFEKMEKITRMIFFTAWDLANREERPALNKDH